LIERLEIVSSSNNFNDLGLVLIGFEDQRDIGRLRSAMIEKEIVGDCRFLATERLRDGWKEPEEHMHMDRGFFSFHRVIGGRF
jgi:hypothetical protein